MSLSLLRTVLLLTVILVLLSVVALWSWGRFARSAQGEHATTLPTSADATVLDRVIQPLLDEQDPDTSAAAFLDDPINAFIARVRSARTAERSLDIQYYIWEHDTTGRLLEHEIMRAAERGVRVRLLLDDLSVGGRDNEFLAVDAHPNVEIRLFNPARSRSAGMKRAIEMGLRFVGFNRRMHNKAWVADNRLAIVGGRNIGDEYFGASDATNFRDTDLLLFGPAVEQTSTIFDTFWNAAEVIPLRALHQKGSKWSAEEFLQRREQWLDDAKSSQWVKAMRAHKATIRSPDDITRHLHWSSSITVISDPPAKAAPLARHRIQAGWLLYDINALLYSARRDLWIISPYFVPGPAGSLIMAGQTYRDVDVRVLTNSLAANDVPLVHAGYSKYRPALLDAGVSLYELRPSAKDTRTRIVGSSGASLHSKAFVIDGQRGFLGSFNLDPRSAQLNTEMGVLFDDTGLAAELTRFFEASIAPERAWQVTRNNGDNLRWQAAGGNEWTHEPKTSLGIRVLVRLLRWLPIESQL